MNVAALILAAGLSRRMAPRNKLLTTDASGLAMVARVVRAALASRAAEVIVVTGHQAGAIAESLHGLAPRLVHAPDYAQGMSASLIAGIAALPESADGVLICLADMPLVTPSLLDRLIDGFEAAPQPAIAVPLCNGVRGNPVLWHRSFWAAFSKLSGDQGARVYLDTYAERIAYVETGEEAVLRDFDTVEALKKAVLF